MARLYSNENFALPVVLELRRLGHDVLTLQETGRGSHAMPDDDVLAFATKENRVLLTLNRLHFIRLHNKSAAHAGIVVCTFDSDFSGQANRIHHALLESHALAGKLLRVNRPQK